MTLRPEDIEFVDRTVAQIGRSSDAVIPILQALQEHYRYLPRPALERVCATTRITPAAIWGIATFYDQFRHQPVGTTHRTCLPRHRLSRDRLRTGGRGPAPSPGNPRG
jgi:NADH:ubiquinone oxidoreductase subunit E